VIIAPQLDLPVACVEPISLGLAALIYTVWASQGSSERHGRSFRRWSCNEQECPESSHAKF
jgi:hypothetical protein